MYYIRWIFNFIFMACPYFLFSSLMIVLNIVLNIVMNKWWGMGNCLLIGNTVYLIVQTILSWPIVFELSWWYQKMRFLRTFSLMAAFVYVGVYLFVVIDWLYQIYFEPTKSYEEYQFFDILLNMFLAYNIIFHLHVLPVNLAIFIKEASLWFFPPLLKQTEHTSLDAVDFE